MFFKKEKENDEQFVDTLEKLEMCSARVRLELMEGKSRWNDIKVQSFIPLILNMTDFDWLDLIAKYECKTEDYMIIKGFLDHVQDLMKNGDNLLQAEMREHGL